jgi:predicted ArsR family transcriptional regulator
MPAPPGEATLGPMAGDVDVHRALADPTRAAIFECLRASGTELGVASLAAAVAVHPNTVRAHLGVLERAGLAVSRAEHRVLPGRPKRLWSAAPAPEETEHALLATALVGALEPLDDGAALAEAAGESWGRRLVAGAPAGADALERLEGLLEDRGFAPQRCEQGLAMRRCPFRELAERHPRVVCGFHAGLVAGALAELDAPCRLVELVPWETADRCVARLEPVGA